MGRRGRVLKLAISLGVWIGGWPWRALMRAVGRASATYVVLYYHSVAEHERQPFRRQLHSLRGFARPLRLNERPGGPGNHVLLTFDDALSSYERNALPELLELGVPSAVFVPTGYLGAAPGWETDNNHGLDQDRVMTIDELRLLPAELVDVGSHAVTHTNLVRLTPNERRFELTESLHRLEALLGRPVRTFSFPYGAWTDEIVTECREIGYHRVFTTHPTRYARSVDEYAMGRVLVHPTDWPLEFRLKAVGAYSWIGRALTVRQWIRDRVMAARRAAVNVAMATYVVELPFVA